MRRRTLLASLATLAGGAGCISSGEAPGGLPTEEQPSTSGNTTSSPTDAHTDTRTMTDPALDPPDATDVFADFDCPSFDDHADETVCYHAADAERDLLLAAEPEVFDPALSDDDVETLDFVLYNRSAWPISFNPYAWGIERYDDGEWTHVAPDMHPEPLTELRAGATMRWALPSEKPPSSSGEDGAHWLHVALEPGVYAFHVTVSYGGISMKTPTDSQKPEGRVELVTLFRVEDRIDPTNEGSSSNSTETGSS